MSAVIASISSAPRVLVLAEISQFRFSKAASGDRLPWVMKAHMKRLILTSCVTLSMVWLTVFLGSAALLYPGPAHPDTYPSGELEIQASLIGYNLLWPSSRCCAYSLHIYPDGRETVAANVSTGDSRASSIRNSS